MSSTCSTTYVHHVVAQGHRGRRTLDSPSQQRSWRRWSRCHLKSRGLHFCQQASPGGDLVSDTGSVWASWADAPDVPSIPDPTALPNLPDIEEDWRGQLQGLASSLRGDDAEAAAAEVFGGDGRERVYLVGVQRKGERRDRYTYTVDESLQELARLADTAGLEVVGSTTQALEAVNPRTYIGSGKVLELAAACAELGGQTVIFDDELTPGQLRNLEKALGDSVRLCDRTALILDIFSQRAATREGMLQVELAQSEYQLPRLTRMWSHLERQAGGRTRGMGEKQIEIDKRLLRKRMGQLRRELEEVKQHRRQYRARRTAAAVPVVALVGYTNAGKSTLMNLLTAGGLLAEDKLFATLDPTTRRTVLPSGKEALLTDTVGFIQKLPTQLVAAFRATLEEICDATLLVHVVDVSHPNAAAQTQAVNAVLQELGAHDMPTLTVWNKVDLCAEPEVVAAVAAGRANTVAVCAASGEGVRGLLEEVEEQLQRHMARLDLLVPYSQGSVVEEIHRVGVVEAEEYVEAGVNITAYLPTAVAKRLQPLQVLRHNRQPVGALATMNSRPAQLQDHEADGWLD